VLSVYAQAFSQDPTSLAVQVGVQTGFRMPCVALQSVVDPDQTASHDLAALTVQVEE
jgi:hypothetical protein